MEQNLNPKKILLKVLELERDYQNYSKCKNQRERIFLKFEQVWGTMLANHFLGCYKNAEDLINGFDADNLELFIKKYF